MMFFFALVRFLAFKFVIAGDIFERGGNLLGRTYGTVFFFGG